MDPCPVSRTADIVSGKWTILLVRDLAEGRSRFCELERSLAGISPRTLLAAPARAGGGGHRRAPDLSRGSAARRVRADEKGLALLPIIEDMRAYGLRWLGDADDCMPADVPDAAAVAG